MKSFIQLQRAPSINRSLFFCSLCCSLLLFCFCFEVCDDASRKERENPMATQTSTKINKISTIIICLKNDALQFCRIFSWSFFGCCWIFFVRYCWSPRIRIVMIFIWNLLILISLEMSRARNSISSALPSLLKTDRIIR